MRYFLIDRVTELEVGTYARGIKNVTLTDQVLHDHFPDYPIMPAALILEAASQLGGFLLEMTVNSADVEAPPRRALLSQVDRAKFHALSGPGDQLDITVKYLQAMEVAARLRADVHVGDLRVARAELTFALKTIDIESIHRSRA